MIDLEILSAFKEESKSILSELRLVVEQLEQPHAQFPTDLFKDFSLKIDRVMGAAKTIGQDYPNHLGFQRIGKLAELCKFIGATAAEQKNGKLLPIFAAFWSDTLDVIDDLLNALENEAESTKIAAAFSVVLQKRLEWLAKRVQIKVDRPRGSGSDSRRRGYVARRDQSVDEAI